MDSFSEFDILLQSDLYLNKKSILLLHSCVAKEQLLGIHSMLNIKFDLCAIVESEQEVCVPNTFLYGDLLLPVYSSVMIACKNHQAELLVLLAYPISNYYVDIECAIKSGLTIVNASLSFMKNDPYLHHLAKKHNVHYVDLYDVEN